MPLASDGTWQKVRANFLRRTASGRLRKFQQRLGLLSRRGRTLFERHGRAPRRSVPRSISQIAARADNAVLQASAKDTGLWVGSAQAKAKTQRPHAASLRPICLW